MSKLRNVKITCPSRELTTLVVSSKNLEALKEFMSNYVEASSVVDEGDIEISYNESGAIINCISLDSYATQKELFSMFSDQESWVPHALLG